MPIKYAWNIQGRLFMQLWTHRYPFYRNPHDTMIEASHHRKLLELLINVCTADMPQLCARQMTVKQSVEGKKDMMTFLEITNDHVQLLDGLLDEMHKDIPQFLHHEIQIEELSTTRWKELVEAATKACIEWHIYEPFMNPKIIAQLRDDWVLNPLDQKRLTLDTKTIPKHKRTFTVMA